MPRSTDASCCSSAAGRRSSASCRARSSCATGCTHDPSWRTPRSGRLPRSRPSCRSTPRAVGRDGADRARRPGDGPAHRWRCAPSSTACRCASARARRSQRGRDDARVRARRAHGGAGRAGARRARARRRSCRRRCWRCSSRARRPIRRAPRSSPLGRARGDSRRRRWSPRTCTRSCRGERSALDAGAVNASCDAIEIVDRGRAHARRLPAPRPRSDAGARAGGGRAARQLVGRRIDPLHPAALTVGVLEGGSAENVIPARARARGALRAHRPAGPPGAAQDWCEEVVAGDRGGPRLPRDGRAGRRASRRWRTTPAIVALARELLAAAPASPAAPAVALVRLGRLRLLRRDRAAGDGVRRPGRRPGFTPRPLHHPELLAPDGAVGAVARAQAVLYVAAATPTPSSTAASG